MIIQCLSSIDLLWLIFFSFVFFVFSQNASKADADVPNNNKYVKPDDIIHEGDTIIDQNNEGSLTGDEEDDRPNKTKKISRNIDDDGDSEYGDDDEKSDKSCSSSSKSTKKTHQQRKHYE